MADPLNLARACLEAHALDPATRDRPAFTFATSYDDAAGDTTWTYGEAWERVERTGRDLLALGLERGDRVLIRLPHSPEYAFAFLGATAAGLVPIPASPQLTEEEANFLLEDSQAAVVVTPEGVLRQAQDERRGLTQDERTREAPTPSPLVALRQAQGERTEKTPLPSPQLLGRGDGGEGQTDAEDPAFLIYTSGTTARPKGVLHAHRALRGRALMRDSWQGFGPGDVTLHAGTLNWSYTLGVGLLDPWAAGAHAVLFGGEYDAAGWPRLIERLGVTVFVAVPTVYRQLLKYGDASRLRGSRLRHGLCAGEPLPIALLEEWRAATGLELFESLGMTEVSTYISSGPSTPVRPGSPGRPQPGRRVAILPEDEDAPNALEPLPPGEVGLLAVHRSDPGLMLGYWRRPEEEAAVFRGEWFTGGDLAAIDEDGYVWFHGRADDVIKSFGYRLSPVEIEAALASAPGVAEVAVVGVAVDESKTLVTACVVRADGPEGAATDEAALASHAERHLAGYKRPHQYRFVDSLPRTRNGKVLRRALVQQVLEG